MSFPGPWGQSSGSGDSLGHLLRTRAREGDFREGREVGREVGREKGWEVKRDGRKEEGKEVG